MIIKRDKSIIPACDTTDADRFVEIVRLTNDIDEIGAYKISAVLCLSLGVAKVVKLAREFTDKPLIYDHQKAATDIPETGAEMARMLKGSGVDAFILFPLAGPATQTKWIQTAAECELPVIVGGSMTHERFLHSEGGYVADDAVDRIFKLAAELNVTDYVVPGNKPERIRDIRKTIDGHGGIGTYYAPGFISQGGTISAAAREAGHRWHAIVGRAIYEATDIRRAALELASYL